MIQDAVWVPEPLPELRDGETSIRLDAETNGVEWWDGARPVGWAWYLPESGRKGYAAFGHRGGGNNCTDEQALEWARRELRNIHVLNSQTKFDIHIARVWGADLIAQGCTFGDVQHQAALLDDHRFRFNLDLLAHDFLGPDRGKFTLDVPKGELHLLPAWAVAPYAVEDVTLVHDLDAVMRPSLVKEDLERVLALEERIIPVVVEMEKNGAFLNVELLHQWQEKAAQEYDEQMMFIYRETGLQITSTDSAKQMAALFKTQGIPITAFTGTLDKDGNKKPSFTEDVLRRAAEHDKVIAAMFHASQLADLRSKYLDKYAATVRSDGWIRFNLHQLRTSRDESGGAGTVSGRFSAAGDEHGGFNPQQVASVDKQVNRGWCSQYIVRNLFIPQHGAWLAADAKQIEYRLFADLAEVPEIIAKYNEDRETDYHNVVQEILKQVKPDIGRKRTKITNFCKLYGAGLLKFAWTLETISDEQFAELDAKYRNVRGKNRLMREQEPILQEGIEVYDAYDKMFPAAHRLLELAKRTATERGYVKTLLGRRARFGGKYRRVHSALNRVIQGSAADEMKLFLVDAYNHRHDFGLTMRFTVHDELDTDIQDSSPANIKRFEEFANIQRISLKVPILWSVACGSSWGGAKEKA